MQCLCVCVCSTSSSVEGLNGAVGHAGCKPASQCNCHSWPVCSWGWPPEPGRECSSCHCSPRPGKCSQSQSGCHWKSSDMSLLGASRLVPFDQIKTPLHVTWTAIFQQVCWSGLAATLLASSAESRLKTVLEWQSHCWKHDCPTGSCSQCQLQSLEEQLSRPVL